MHALAPYVIRVRDATLPGPKAKKFHNLDSVRGHDLLTLLHQTLSSAASSHTVISEGKRNRLAMFSDIQIDHKNRVLSGFFEAGDFGIKGRLINSKNGNEVYKKKVGDADLSLHYFSFYVPKGKNHGVALFHEVQGKGVKSMVCSLIMKKLESTLKAAQLRIEPITTDRAVDKWMSDANVKQIRLTRYAGNEFLGDFADRVGQTSAEVTIKPLKRNMYMGKMRDFFSPSESNTPLKSQLLSAVSHKCDSVKVVASLGGRQRTFSIVSNSFAASIEFDESDVKMSEGTPEADSLRNWARQLTVDIATGL